MNGIDGKLFVYINNFAGRWPALDFLGIFLGEYLAFVLAAVLLVVVFYPPSKKLTNRVMVCVSAAAAIIARWVVKEFILLFVHRLRPYGVVIGGHKLITTPKIDDFQSFPSGHAIFFFALAMSLFCFNRKLGAWFFAAALLMGIARIYIGVHWPSDILAGAAMGIIIGWATYHLYLANKELVDRWVTKASTAFHI